MRSHNCKDCGSTGKCPTCNGSGKIDRREAERPPLPCATCFGSKRCPTCVGNAKRQAAELPSKARRDGA